MLFKVTFDKEIHILKSANAKTLAQLKTMVPRVFKTHPQNFYLTYLDEDSDEITLASEADFGILLSAGVKSAKIMIREKNEDFYDETQKIQLEEEEPREIEAMMEKDSFMNDASEIRSNAPLDKSIDESIEEKIRNMLPGLISKIKNEVQEEVNKSRLDESSKQNETSTESQPKVVHPHIICDGCGMSPITGHRYKCAVCNDFDLCEKCEAKSDHPHPFLKIKHPHQRPLKIFVVLPDEEDSVEFNGQRQQMNGLSQLIGHGINFAQQFMQGFNQHPPQGRCTRHRQAQQSEQKEEKTEEKKQETKVEEKVVLEAPKKAQNIEKPKKEEVKKQEPKKEEPKKEEPKKEEPKKEVRKVDEQSVIEGANYLSQILSLKFTTAYKFAQQNLGLTKEQLLNLYLSR